MSVTAIYTYGPQQIGTTADHLLRTCVRALETQGAEAAWNDPPVFALVGQLGAGKTTLVSALCERLGVTEPTSSPTFSLVNEYAGAGGPVYHLDCYRLDTVEEAIDAGIEELLQQGRGPVFVEWPAVIEPLLPPTVVILRLDYADEGRQRQLTLTQQQP